MAIIRNGKVYRNIQEQVLKNTEDIEELNHRLPIEGKFYTEEETDVLLALKADKEEVNEELDLKADKSNTYNKTEINNLLADKLDIIHLYQANFVYNNNGVLYLGNFMFTSQADVASGNYNASQAYNLFGNLYIYGSGGAINTDNEVIRTSPILDLESSSMAALYSEYDSVEGDWVDDEIILASISITKLF